MASTGEVIKQLATGIYSKTTSTAPELTLENDIDVICCFTLKALANNASSSVYQNDFHSFLYWFDNSISSVAMALQKLEGDTVVGNTTLNDNTYGTYYAFGFHTADNNNYVGYKLEWKNVLLAFGSGKYRLRVVTTDIFSNTQTYYSFEFCLETYTAIRADETLRLEYTHDGIIGDIDTPGTYKNYRNLEWVNQIRLPGIMWGDKSSYEKEETEYNTGILRDVVNKQTPTYEIELYDLPHYLHNYIKTDIFQADKILCTDYNSDNPNKPIIDRDIKLNGDYSPQWKGRNPYASVITEVKDRINVLEKKYC